MKLSSVFLREAVSGEYQYGTFKAVWNTIIRPHARLYVFNICFLQLKQTNNSKKSFH